MVDQVAIVRTMVAYPLMLVPVLASRAHMDLLAQLQPTELALHNGLSRTHQPIKRQQGHNIKTRTTTHITKDHTNLHHLRWASKLQLCPYKVPLEVLSAQASWDMPLHIGRLVSLPHTHPRLSTLGGE